MVKNKNENLETMWKYLLTNRIVALNEIDTCLMYTLVDVDTSTKLKLSTKVIGVSIHDR